MQSPRSHTHTHTHSQRMITITICLHTQVNNAQCISHVHVYDQHKIKYTEASKKYRLSWTELLHIDTSHMYMYLMFRCDNYTCTCTMYL